MTGAEALSGADKVIGLSAPQYLALICGLAILGWLLSGLFRRKK